MTYTHTAGQRNRFVDFSNGILKMNKPAGLIVRMNQTSGEPEIDGTSNLKGKKVVDVVGWAPTNDGLAIVENRCTTTGEKRGRFLGYTIITPTVDTGNANDDALVSRFLPTLHLHGFCACPYDYYTI